MANTLRKILFGGLVALTLGISVYRYKLIHNSRVESSSIGEISDLCKEQEVLGNYPNFLGDNLTVVYSIDVDKNWVDDLVKGLKQYGVTSYSSVHYLDSTPVKGNFISIGDPCLNKKTREVLELSLDSCDITLKYNQSQIEIPKNAPRSLLVYGIGGDPIRRALFSLKNPEWFREKLRQSGSLCNKGVTVSGTTYFAVEKTKLE